MLLFQHIKTANAFLPFYPLNAAVYLDYLNQERKEENLTPVINPTCHILTSGISVEQERVLELEIKVFSNRFCSIFHAQSVHDCETMPWRSWSEEEQVKEKWNHNNFFVV